MRDFNSLALVSGNDFRLRQVRAIGFFNEAINLVDLQQRIMQNNLQDKVPSITDRLGISNAARHYKKFLWIHFDAETRDEKEFVRLVATDPTTLNNLFIAERELVNPLMTWNGYTDPNTWFPLFNRFIDWLKAN